MNEFGEILKVLRMRKGYTQAQLADSLGISASAVGMYERGLRQPSPEQLIKLSKIFMVSADYLLGIEKAPESVEELLKTIHASLDNNGGLTFNGVELNSADIKKLFNAMSIVANVILNDKMREFEEE